MATDAIQSWDDTFNLKVEGSIPSRPTISGSDTINRPPFGGVFALSSTCGTTLSLMSCRVRSRLTAFGDDGGDLMLGAPEADH